MKTLLFALLALALPLAASAKDFVMSNEAGGQIHLTFNPNPACQQGPDPTARQGFDVWAVDPQGTTITGCGYFMSGTKYVRVVWSFGKLSTYALADFNQEP